MNLKESIANNPVICKGINKTTKAAPTVAFIAGAVCSAASLYFMWKAARKHDDVVAEVTDLIEEVHEKKEETEDLPSSEYRKALLKAYVNAGWKLGKLYAPTAITEVAGIGLMSLGYGKINQRYTSTLAACTIAEHALASYRKNVIDVLGEDADREFRFGLKEKEFEVPETDKNGNIKTDKNGEVKTKKVKDLVLPNDDMEGYSGYARIFDAAHCTGFDGNSETGMATSFYNKQFLMSTQNFFNQALHYRPNHTVFLNEVYIALGYQPTKEGQVVGWHYDPDHPTGDNKIEFIPIEFFNEKTEMKSVILDFNVDGNVLDLV